MRASSVVLLPHAPSSVAIARRSLCADLRASGVPESVVDDAGVVVSELLSNALRHARPLPTGQISMSWTYREDMLELSVSDGGAMTEPRRGPGTLSSLGGRGLGIVEALAEGWGVRHEDGRTTVWASLHASGKGAGAHADAAGPQSVDAIFPDLPFFDSLDGDARSVAPSRTQP